MEPCDSNSSNLLGWSPEGAIEHGCCKSTCPSCSIRGSKYEEESVNGSSKQEVHRDVCEAICIINLLPNLRHAAWTSKGMFYISLL